MLTVVSLEVYVDSADCEGISFQCCFRHLQC